MSETNLDIVLSHLCGSPVSVSVRGVTKSFGGRKVLKNVSLEILPGEMFVFLGRSGSGKTTLLRHICGLERPDEGKIFIGSETPESTSATVSIVFQSSALFNSMTAAENVELFIREHAVTGDEQAIKKISSAALGLVGLAGREGDYPSELSGGMKRRVAIARALLTNPDLILFDEPTTGLDPVTKKSIEQLLLVLKRKVGVTQIIVTHDISLAFSLAERLSIMHGGEILKTATPSEIASSRSPLVRSFLPDAAKFPENFTAGR